MATVESIYNRLLSGPQDVLVSEAEAVEIWKAFQGSSEIPRGALRSFKARAFLQAAMMGWLEASVSIRWFEAILMASLKPSATILSLIGKLTLEALKVYYEQHVKRETPLYIMVRSTIVQQNRPYFLMLSQGLELP